MALPLPVTAQACEYHVEWKADAAKDVSFHMALGIEEDLEDHLETLARHRRLGQFKMALKKYEARAEAFRDEPLAAVEYAELLVEQGNFKRLARGIRDETIVFDLPDGQANESLESRHSCALLRVKWSLLLDNNRSHTHLQRAGTERLWRRAQRAIRSTEGTGSTEMSVFAMCLRLIADLSTYSSSVHPFNTGEYKADWVDLYQQLMVKGMVWELADVICASVSAFGVVETWTNLFQREFYADDFFDLVKKDWKHSAYDQSTSLALLDILIYLALWLDIQLCFEADVLHLVAMERCLNECDELIHELLEEDPSSMKTRQYARWILAKAKLKNYSPESGQAEENAVGKKVLNGRYRKGYLDAHDGIQLWHSGLPIYLDSDGRNPGWQAAGIDASVLDLLRVPLKLARDLGDFSTEVLCLQEIIRVSAAPTPVFDELATLQKDVQQDAKGHLETLLSSYLAVKSSKAMKAALREELVAVFKRFGTEENKPPLLEYAYCVIRGVLESNPEAKQTWVTEADYILDNIGINMADTSGYTSMRPNRRGQRQRNRAPYRDSRRSKSKGPTSRWVGVGNIISLNQGRADHRLQIATPELAREMRRSREPGVLPPRRPAQAEPDRSAWYREDDDGSPNPSVILDDSDWTDEETIEEVYEWEESEEEAEAAERAPRGRQRRYFLAADGSDGEDDEHGSDMCV